jgi:hypothetical protein
MKKDYVRTHVNDNNYLEIGDKIRLKRRHDEMNGWSIRPDLDGVVVTITNVEDRVNGCVQATHPIFGKLAFFANAVGEVVEND